MLNGIISISLHNLVCFKAVFYNINAMKTDGRQQLFPILRISVLFALGIWTGESGLCTNGSWAWIFSSAILLLITVALHKHPVWQSVLLLVSSFSAGGSCVTASLEAQHATFNKGESAYEAVITSTPSVHGKVVMCDIMPTDMPRPFKIRASILRDERTSSLRVGDGISTLSVLEQPHNSKGLAFDYARYLVRHGYSGQTFIYKTNWCLTDADSGNLPFFTRARLLALKYRQRLLDIYRHLGFDGDTFSVLSAMTLGDKENMTKELREQFSVSGASHVLALSGLHLGIIYAILSCLFVWRRRSVAGHVISLSAIWAYVFVTGMSPSTVRSALMISVYALAVMSGRARMSLNALSAAALLMLAISPCDVFDVGFQMSFAAVFFIQHRATIAENFSTLGIATTMLLLCAIALALVLCLIFRLKTQERRTIVIEVGMQNAAQAIAIASSPFVFNDGRIAIPAIIYALMMNVILLIYVGIVSKGKVI